VHDVSNDRASVAALLSNLLLLSVVIGRICDPGAGPFLHDLVTAVWQMCSREAIQRIR
jgi:hypothetical protein